MEKRFSVLVFFWVSFCFSQSEKLFVFREKDSLTGVKTESGKIIIPARRIIMSNIYDGQGSEIKESLLFFWFSHEGPKAFNRKGEFVFVPYLFDMSFDDFNEGFMRFTDAKKIGFVDRTGKRIIEAKYDWISPFRFGFARYCNGCYFDTKQDEEHPPLVGGNWGYIDKNGQEIMPTKNRNHPRDLQTKKDGFIPYQFTYNTEEQKILDYFETRTAAILEKVQTVCVDSKIYFEITEKPTELNPYFVITPFEFCNANAFTVGSSNSLKGFKVSADAKNFYACYDDLVNYKDYSEYVERRVPVDQWLKLN